MKSLELVDGLTASESLVGDQVSAAVHLSSFKLRHQAVRQALEGGLTNSFAIMYMYEPITLTCVKKLLEMGSLSLKHTMHMVFDMEKDKKQITSWELKDTATRCDTLSCNPQYIQIQLIF
ncbi:hypothetical protein PF008_g14474 [Phytophthora fragariae]|uniref:Uncharacterized protein n=1 Tax=Phytophthora fragariae TaxID=53985 RepID=A0A6G0RGW2_9STRA|nr:hypothetical protein PF008_g14474 [Phytophthora fragariae]